ncbi:MAG: DUF6585 family protein [Beutenbergiaceae bacterium]
MTSSSTGPGPGPSNSANDGARKFGALPILSIFTMVLLSAIGVGAYIWGNNAPVRAMCGSEQMGPADICETITNGVPTGTETYTEVLASAQRTNEITQYVGLALMVLGVALAVFVVIRWRQDVTLKSQLRDDHGTPLGQYARTASGNMLFILIGAAAAGAATFFLLTGMARSEPLQYLGAALFGAIAVAGLVAGLPQNGQLIQTFNDGVRVISRGKIADVAWTDVKYSLVINRNVVTHNLGGPGLKSIVLGGMSNSAELIEQVQVRSAQAKVPPAMQHINQGQALQFGAVTLSREGISKGRKSVTWPDFSQIRLKGGTVVVTSRTQGKAFTVQLAKTTDYPLLLALSTALAQQASPGQATALP